MVMYEPFDDNDNISVTSLELPFDVHENPSKIMCFFVVDDDSDIYALVQSCDNSNHDDKDSCLFQHWTEEFQYRGHVAKTILRAVPVESFGHQVLVIEDDASIVEQLRREDLKVGVTVVIPCDEYC